MFAFINQSFDIAGIGDQNTACRPIEESQCSREGKDVIKRQSAHGHFFTFLKGNTDPAAGLFNVGQNISVREHGAFGYAGCAARVL